MSKMKGHIPNRSRYLKSQDHESSDIAPKHLTKSTLGERDANGIVISLGGPLRVVLSSSDRHLPESRIGGEIFDGTKRLPIELRCLLGSLLACEF
jgi:hypothetical protein